MGTHSEVVGGETSPETSDTLLGDGLHDAVGHALVGHLTGGVGLLLLHLGLDVVEGKGADSGGDGGDHGATEVDLRLGGIGSETLGGEVLSGIVRDKHAHVKGNSSRHGGNGTSPESEDTLVSDNTGESVKDVLVVAALSLGKGGISLHADKGEIARVSNEGTEGSSGERSSSSLQNGEVLTIVLLLLDVFGEVEVDSETEGSVDDLSEESRVESSVELFDTTDLVDLLGDVDGGGGTTGLRSELDADLDHVNGLNAAGGGHGRQGTNEEVLVEVGHRF